MKKKTLCLALALALSLSLAGCKKEDAPTAPAGVAVQVQTVEAQDIASENTVSGQVTAGSETSVYVTSTAKCTAVYVQAGDTVKAGDVICSLDMESALAQYRAIDDVVKGAEFIRDVVLPKMDALRAPCDEAETCTAEEYWPFPTYGDLLFGVK